MEDNFVFLLHLFSNMIIVLIVSSCVLYCMETAMKPKSSVYFTVHLPVSVCPITGLPSVMPRELAVNTKWTVDCVFFFGNVFFQVAHPVVGDQLLRYFNDGFLVPVVGPALHQVRPFTPCQELRPGITVRINLNH